MSATQIRGSTQIKDSSIPASKVDNSIIVAAGSNAFTGNQSMGGYALTNLAAPVNSTDAATKSYVDTAVDNAIQGRDYKQSVRVASTANVSTSSAPSSIDGVTLSSGDRILLKDQTTGSQNGIWVFNGSGSALTRATDADANAEVTAGLAVFVTEGTINADTQWALTTNDPITVGTTALTFAQIGGSTSYTAGTGLALSGTTFSADFGSASGKVCEGNDSRLSDARTPVGTALAEGKIWVGNGSGAAAAVTPSGDVSLASNGAFTVSGVVKIAKVVTRETPSGTINGSNAVFTLAATPVSGTETVFVNGISQDAGSGNDYTISGDTITFESGCVPQSGDKVRVSYISQ